jgi:hypothetical protein
MKEELEKVELLMIMMRSFSLATIKKLIELGTTLMRNENATPSKK